MIKKVKHTVPWTCVIDDLNVEEIVGTFYELQKRIAIHKKELQKTKSSKKD